MSEGSDYFQLLVRVFGKQFDDAKQSHLKKFFIIVPPLTVNYVEHIISAKEKMTKKNKDGAGNLPIPFRFCGRKRRKSPSNFK